MAWLLRMTRIELSVEVLPQGAARVLEAARAARKREEYCILILILNVVIGVVYVNEGRKESKQHVQRKYGNREKKKSLRNCFLFLISDDDRKVPLRRW